MYSKLIALSSLLAGIAAGQMQPPENLVLDGISPVPAPLASDIAPYLDFRTASMNGWHPVNREMLIATRFAETMQLHLVKVPLGARRQLTFSAEPVTSGSFRPVTGEFIVYSQDAGGGEFYQLYRFDPLEGKTTLLTDGKSRNMGARWSHSGKWLAYTSTRRNGRDNDIFIMDPAQPGTDRLLHQVTGGGWSIQDWSHDESKLLLANYISINKSDLYLLDISAGAVTRLTPDSAEPISFSNARFARNDQSVFLASDIGSQFKRLMEFRLPLPGRMFEKPSRVLSDHISWDISEIELSRDGKTLAFVANENGLGVLHLLNTRSGKERRVGGVPAGILSGIQWHPNSRDLAFNISSAKSPADVFSIDTRSGKLERWTESETGGIHPGRLVEPQLMTVKSFDGLEFSAFVYRPDQRRFPGKRPAVINIHGGPESQFRPGFQARNNYYINEMGITLIYPNVRGSSGYGKSFVAADNGFQREDSVRDIGALLTQLRSDPLIDPERIAVMGGSYGGYMVLASMAFYNDQLRCGVDVVGISNFLTFLKNTQDYRRDLRRVEYGDERDPAMASFLEKISPTSNVNKMKKPLLVVQGKNDPRVPVTEAEQMVKALRGQGGTVWYLLGKDEGHGFAKKKNADFQFLVTVLFLQQHLVN